MNDGHENRRERKERKLDEKYRGQYHDMKGKYHNLGGKEMNKNEKYAKKNWAPIKAFYKEMSNVHTGAFKLEIEAIIVE
jgi:hypothetical protein